MPTLADLVIAMPTPERGEGSTKLTARNLAVSTVLSIMPAVVARLDSGDAQNVNMYFTTPYDAKVKSLALNGDVYVHVLDGKLRVMLRAVWTNDHSNAIYNHGDSGLQDLTVAHLTKMLEKLGPNVWSENAIDGRIIIIEFPF